MSRSLLALLGILSLVVCMGAATTASAQDPAGDQYAPSTPDGTDPDPQSGEGGKNDTGGLGASNSGGSGGPTIPQSTSDDYTPSSELPSSSGGTSSGKATHSQANRDESNKAQRTLGKLSDSATADREAALSAGDSTPATETLSSSSESDSGMGLALWILLGATALWAIGSAIVRHRNRPDRKRELTGREGETA